jgi:NADP-dependent 3-hydroxy acid dehydrogenase YdfG
MMSSTGISPKKYGQWAIVTGASDGIGKAFAIELAAKGFSLVLVARRLELLEQLGKELSTKHSIEYKAISLDFSLSTATWVLPWSAARLMAMAQQVGIIWKPSPNGWQRIK